MIAAGTYAAVVVPINTPNGQLYCQFGESGTKRTPLVSIRFEILRGPYAGQTIGYYGYFPEDKFEQGERTIKGLRACGFKSDDFGAMQTEVVNQECEIVVETEEYKGRTRPRVLWINPVSSGMRIENTMDPSKLRLFSARFGKTLKQIGVISGPEAQREAPAVEQPGQVDRSGSFDQSRGDDGDPGPGDDDGHGRDTRLQGDDIPF